MPVPVAPTAAVAGQPSRAGVQFNALAAQAAYVIGGMPLFIGRQATVQAIPTAVWTAVTLDAADVDRDAGHSLTVNISRYTSATAGWYDCQGAGSFANATAGRRISRLQVNGGAVTGTASGGAGGVTASFTLQTTGLVYLSVNDYLEVAVFQDSGAALNTNVNFEQTSRLVARWVST